MVIFWLDGAIIIIILLIIIMFFDSDCCNKSMRINSVANMIIIIIFSIFTPFLFLSIFPSQMCNFKHLNAVEIVNHCKNRFIKNKNGSKPKTDFKELLVY